MADFWDLSLAEIYDAIRIYARTRGQETKEKVSLQFMQARLIAEQFGGDKDTPPSRPWDWYPELFAEEKVAFEAAARQDELEEFKTRRAAFVAAYNARRKGRKGN